MPSLPASPYFRDEVACFKFVGVILLMYYCVMDIIMFMTFMKTDLSQSARPYEKGELFSPFTHLSVKGLMNDHTSQYVIWPAAEYFDTFTHFSTVFSFISPNMISFFHLFLAAVVCRLMSSESLQSRRLAVLLFEFRTFLDALDGVVYRSHSNTKGIYQSVRSTTGYYVDIMCDLIGGVFMMFGVLFYLFKRFDPARANQLPLKSTEAGIAVNGGPSGQTLTYSKKMLFWKCWCYGLAVALAGKFWDNIVGDLKSLFQTPMTDPAMSALQFETCHSFSSILIMWVWRLVEGQALLQYVLLAVFLDKIWEFLNWVQYLASVIIISLFVISLLYVRHLHVVLHV